MNRSISLYRALANRGLFEVALNNAIKIQIESRTFHGFVIPEAASSLFSLKPLYCQQVRHAARKGTRDRKAKKKVKVEEKKEEFVPYQIRKAMMNIPTKSKRTSEVGKPQAIDDVYCMRHYISRVYSAADAIECLRESNHPTVYNNPDGVIYVSMELDHSLDKKNRYLDSFSRVLLLPHSFALGEPKRVLAFCKTQEAEQAALEAGAQVGGLDFIKRVQVGETSLNDYDHVVAHTNMLTDITPLRGLLKKKFPSTKTGSVGTNIGAIVERFLKGIEFSSTKDQHELDFGSVEVPIGRLTMPTEHLEANLSTILKDVAPLKARASKPLITRCVLKCPPSSEKLLINHELYVGKLETDKKGPVIEDKNEEEESDSEEEEKQKASN